MSEEKLKPIHWLRNYLTESIDHKQSIFLGQVLTIIDASISDKEQRKGIKDLIQNEYYRDRRYAGIREIILEFCQKYCPETIPDTQEGINKFLGQIKHAEHPSDPAPVEWNFEK